MRMGKGQEMSRHMWFVYTIFLSSSIPIKQDDGDKLFDFITKHRVKRGKWLCWHNWSWFDYGKNKICSKCHKIVNFARRAGSRKDYLEDIKVVR